MRQPTTEEKKNYRYMTTIVIDVKRTDNQPLTDDENKMVDQMRVAAEQAVAEVMKANGNSNSKHLGTARKIY